MRFGSTKGEIRVKKGDFRGDLFFFRGLDLVWESATPSTHIWESFPKKNVFLNGFPKQHKQIIKEPFKEQPRLWNLLDREPKSQKATNDCPIPIQQNVCHSKMICFVPFVFLNYSEPATVESWWQKKPKINDNLPMQWSPRTVCWWCHSKYLRSPCLCFVENIVLKSNQS